jgi:hypothetical protein
VPHVRPSVRGPEMICFDCFSLLISQKALVGLRPSYSAHVRFGERGAPVQFLLDSVRELTPALQNSILPWKAIMRGELSPPNPTPSNPVGGEMVLVKAPKPV